MAFRPEQSWLDLLSNYEKPRCWYVSTWYKAVLPPRHQNLEDVVKSGRLGRLSTIRGWVICGRFGNLPLVIRARQRGPTFFRNVIAFSVTQKVRVISGTTIASMERNLFFNASINQNENLCCTSRKRSPEYLWTLSTLFLDESRQLRHQTHCYQFRADWRSMKAWCANRPKLTVMFIVPSRLLCCNEGKNPSFIVIVTRFFIIIYYVFRQITRRV